MGLIFDSFWRAVAYCLHPRVIALSVLPLLLMVALSFALGYFFWEPAVAAVAAWLQNYELVGVFLNWLDQVGAGAFRTVFAPLLVLVVATPGIVFLTLLLVALTMTPQMVALVAQRRFAALERKRGGSLIASVFWSLGSTLLALVVMVLTMPLWLVPPLVLLLPPLIWGWLTYRVFAFDALADHASKDERTGLIKTHRGPLLVMGVVTGFLGAAPSLIWASGAMFIVAAPLLVPLAIWIYTLVFAFASLWFAHYLLAALERLRAVPAPVRPASDATPTMASKVLTQDVEDVWPKAAPGSAPSLPGPSSPPPSP
ncbi:MAG: EI24 domain-containing protein [Hydrogenophaga sp.]|nr:EI24 domain-containing protein [Hydrogenophaga sp.]